jgi:hypothetical protein
MAEPPMTSELQFPGEDIVQLSVAFNMLGKHRFGQEWETVGDMTLVTHLGQSRRHSVDVRAMAGWANKAMMQCVRNGWLPVIYFEGDRRHRYFDNPNGREICRVHVRPLDNDERGQIEFADGSTAFCVSDVCGFVGVLKAKFGARAEIKPGPKREFAEFDAPLDLLFQEISPRTSTADVRRAINKAFKGNQPKKSTLYQRIDEARERALAIR